MVRVSGVTVDITERKRAEERQNLLTREVDHRAKNALALAQSIVRLTRARTSRLTSRPSKGGSARWRGSIPSCRCRAGRARKSAGWSTKSSRLIPPAIRSRSAARTSTAARTAQTLALALHELVTNSAKYGALSTVSGRLVHQMGDRDGRSTDGVEERDGPLVQKPVSRGFGTRSVIASIESQLGGQAEFDWRAEGLVCRCRFRWRRMRRGGRPTAAQTLSSMATGPRTADA